VELDDERQVGKGERQLVLRRGLVAHHLAAGGPERFEGGGGVLGQQVEVVARAHPGVGVVPGDLRPLQHHQGAVVGRGHARQQHGHGQRGRGGVSLLLQDRRRKGAARGPPMSRRDGAQAVVEQIDHARRVVGQLVEPSPESIIALLCVRHFQERKSRAPRAPRAAAATSPASGRSRRPRRRAGS
jgi:hypothetical protein